MREENKVLYGLIPSRTKLKEKPIIMMLYRPLLAHGFYIIVAFYPINMLPPYRCA